MESQSQRLTHPQEDMMTETPSARRSFVKLLLATPLALMGRLFAAPTAVERRMVDEKQIAQDALDALMNRGDGSVLQRNGFDTSRGATDAFLSSLGHQVQVAHKGGSYRTIFPDGKVTILGATQQGNVVTLKWRADGTHRGALGNLAPSGKRVSVPGTTEVTFANGKISKFVSAFDHNLLRSQMGAPRVG
jgi:predicted ester cyclase